MEILLDSSLDIVFSMLIASGRRCRLAAATLALVLAGCGGSPSTPSPPPAPVAEPPKITCPASQTVQATSDGATAVQYASPSVVNGTAPVVTACTPPSGSSFIVGQTSVTCTATDAAQRADACTFSVTVLPVPVLAATSMLAFGDSITWGEDGIAAVARTAGTLALTQDGQSRVQVPISQTYPEVLHQDLVQRYTKQTPTVLNAGKPGEEVTNPATFKRFTSFTSSGRYDVVLIMEGSNDLEDKGEAIEPAVIEGLRSMIRDAKSRSIRPYLATIPPQNASGLRGEAAGLVSGFNEEVRALAGSEGVPLVDVYAALNVDIPTYIGPDGLHPTAVGYAKIAETFLTTIEKTLEVTAPGPAARALRSRK